MSAGWKRAITARRLKWLSADSTAHNGITAEREMTGLSSPFFRYCRKIIYAASVDNLTYSILSRKAYNQVFKSFWLCRIRVCSSELSYIPLLDSCSCALRPRASDGVIVIDNYRKKSLSPKGCLNCKAINLLNYFSNQSITSTSTSRSTT